MTVAVILGACWRLWLMGRYAGWEESDYGNLAMIQGVLDGGFRHYDMNHMPGYYAMSAMVHAWVGDALVAGRSVSFVGGLAALGLSVFVAMRIGGHRVAWLVAALLIFQPEFALYSASTLREPLAAAFLMGVLGALSGEKILWAGICAAGAFFVRFDTALVLFPVLAIHAVGVGMKLKRLSLALGPLVAAVAMWALYCHVDHGTWQFWSHSVQVNLDTGLGAEAEVPGAWWSNGAVVSGTLVAWLLPWRIGLGVWCGLLVGLLFAVRQAHGLLRSVGIQAFLMLGLWAGIGFVGQHEPSHNLYWKWLYPIIPVIMPLAGLGVWQIGDWLGRRGLKIGAIVWLVLTLCQGGVSNLKETHRQWQRSEAWYRPQLELAQWIEVNIPEGTPMVLDNIPACWIRRRPNMGHLVSWFDVPSRNEAEFAQWLKAEDIQWVLWFREDWTQAPRVAPFLADGGGWKFGDEELVERRREDGYGWIFFERVNGEN